MSILDNYETVGDTAKRLGLDRSRILKLCRQGRLTGTQVVGEGTSRARWLIPKDAWPTGARYGPPGKWEETRPQSEWVRSSPDS